MFQTLPRILLPAFAFFAVSVGSAKTLIISDIDDTIRISQIAQSSISKYLEGLREGVPFQDMAPLYRHLSRNFLDSQGRPDSVEIFYVSNTPEWVEKYLLNTSQLDFLMKFKFPFADSAHLFLRDSSLNQDYKVSTIIPLIKKHHSHLANGEKLRVLLIGDNGEADPVTYAKVLQAFAGQKNITWAQFLRQIYVPGTPIAKKNGQIPFVYSSEIIAHLISTGHLEVGTSSTSAAQTESYLRKNLTLIQRPNFLPEWYRCKGHSLKLSTESPRLNPVAVQTIFLANLIKSRCNDLKVAEL